MDRSQGAQANFTGNRLERFIENNLIGCGFAKVADKAALSNAMHRFSKPSYASQVNIGQTIYGTDLVCDFLLFHPQKWPEGLVIEAKWQQSTGTVDEKYPYFVLNIWSSEYATIFVLDGGGYRPGAEEWVRGMQKDNLLQVFNMAEFQIWVNEGNL